MARSAVEEGDDGPDVRLGLTTVRGLGQAVAERICAGAPWHGQEDLVRRAGVSRAQLEALAAAGALDAAGTSRRQARRDSDRSGPDRLCLQDSGKHGPQSP